MDASIASILLLDGLTNGAVYALLGLATVLVFAVTRIIFIPQGEFVAYGALTLAILQTGKVPGTVWLLLILAVVTSLVEGVAQWQHQRHAPRAIKAAFTMTGLGLLFFGAEGFRNPTFWDLRLPMGPVTFSGQTLIIFAASIALIVLLWLFFERSLYGKALRATAVNRLGARLMGISSNTAGQLTFLMAALIGALSGLLIGPTTTVYYDSGFLIGLKGFVAAVMGGLSSYPVALVGALFVGTVEAFASFWASAFKEVIVFSLVLPILLWRSLSGGHDEEH